ncbi:MAG: putative ABC transporter permease, partial [Candidatus Gallimonas sp.]
SCEFMKGPGRKKNAARMIPTPMQKQKEESVGFDKAVVVYLIGGLVGTVWETLLNLVRGDGFRYCNGSIFTPFNFVYGTGALFIVCVLRNRTKWWEVYLAGALGGGAIEYLLSFLEEGILGTRSWDYSNLPLNLNGRTTLPIMIFWGALCLFVVFVVYRPLNAWLGSLPSAMLRTFCVAAFVFLLLDGVITVSALLRYVARNAGRAPLTFVGRLVDVLFDDSFMRLRFPSMKLSS